MIERLYKQRMELKQDLDELQAMINRKKTQYIQVASEIMMMESDIPEKKIVIDCVEIEDEA